MIRNPLDAAVSRFGAALKAKLTGGGVAGAPENQSRAPLEALVADMAAIALFRPGDVVAVGKTSLSHLKTRPDYAVKVKNALAGFIEVKAPGKGADPRQFRDEHDQTQRRKPRSLPNLIHTDGNAFSLWRDGEPHGDIVRLQGGVETACAGLRARPGWSGRSRTSCAGTRSRPPRRASWPRPPPVCAGRCATR